MGEAKRADRHRPGAFLVRFPPEAKPYLEGLARAAGLPVAAYLRRLVEREAGLAPGGLAPPRRPGDRS